LLAIYSLHSSATDLARHFGINSNIRFSIDLTATTGVTHMVKKQIGQRGRRKRDYRKEYERRVQRGLAKGLSMSQARGHARPTEAPVSRKAISFEQWSRVLELAVARMREGDSLTSAARNASVSPERLTRYVARTGIAEKYNGRWRLLDDTRIRVVPLYSDGRLVELQVGLLTASKIGAYMASVGHALRKNSFEALPPKGSGQTPLKPASTDPVHSSGNPTPQSRRTKSRTHAAQTTGVLRGRQNTGSRIAWQDR
jgi:hypothetical protein